MAPVNLHCSHYQLKPQVLGICSFSKITALVELADSYLLVEWQVWLCLSTDLILSSGTIPLFQSSTIVQSTTLLVIGRACGDREVCCKGNYEKHNKLNAVSSPMINASPSHLRFFLRYNSQCSPRHKQRQTQHPECSEPDPSAVMCYLLTLKYSGKTVWSLALPSRITNGVFKGTPS